MLHKSSSSRAHQALSKNFCLFHSHLFTLNGTLYKMVAPSKFFSTDPCPLVLPRDFFKKMQTPRTLPILLLDFVQKLRKMGGSPWLDAYATMPFWVLTLWEAIHEIQGMVERYPNTNG